MSNGGDGTIRFDVLIDGLSADQQMQAIAEKAKRNPIKIPIAVDTTSRNNLEALRKAANSPIAPRVDLSQLHELNKVIDIKIDHLGELGRVANKPIKPRIDGSEISAAIGQLDDLDRKLEQLRRGQRFAIGIEINASTYLNGLEKDLEKAVTQGFKKATKTNPFGDLAKLILSPVKAVSTGFLEGIGRELSKGLGKGLNEGLADLLSPTFGSSQLFGERLVALSASAAKSYANKTIKELTSGNPNARAQARQLKKEFAAVVGEFKKFYAGDAGQTSIDREYGYRREIRDRQRYQREDIAAEGLNLDRRELTKAAITAREEKLVSQRRLATFQRLEPNAEKAVSHLLSRRELVEFGVRDGSESQAALARVNKGLERAIAYYTQIKVARENAAQEVERRKISESQNFLNAERVKDRIDALSPEVNPYLQEIANTVTGRRVSRREMPQILTVDPRSGVRKDTIRLGAYAAQANLLIIPESTKKALDNGFLSTDNTPTLAHEIQHVADYGFGSVSGIRARARGTILSGPKTYSPEEIALFAGRAAYYNPKTYVAEQSAAAAELRFGVPLGRKFEGQRELRDITTAVGYGGAGLPNVTAPLFSQAKAGLGLLLEGGLGAVQSNKYIGYVEQARAAEKNLLSEINAAFGQGFATPGLSQKIENTLGVIKDTRDVIRLAVNELPSTDPWGVHRPGAKGQIDAPYPTFQGGRIVSPWDESGALSVAAAKSVHAEIVADPWQDRIKTKLANVANTVESAGRTLFHFGQALQKNTAPARQAIGQLYGFAEGVESAALPFVPFGRQIKAAGKHIALPAAAYAGLGILAPGAQGVLGGAVGGLLHGGGGLAQPLLQGAASQAFGGIPLVGSGIANGITALAGSAGSALSEVLIPVVAGKIMASAVKSTVALPQAAVAKQRQLGAASAQEVAIAAKSLYSVTDSPLRQLDGTPIPQQKTLGWVKSVSKKFNESYRSIQQAIDGGNIEFARVLMATVQKQSDEFLRDIEQARRILPSSGKQLSGYRTSILNKQRLLAEKLKTIDVEATGVTSDLIDEQRVPSWMSNAFNFGQRKKPAKPAHYQPSPISSSWETFQPSQIPDPWFTGAGHYIPPFQNYLTRYNRLIDPWGENGSFQPKPDGMAFLTGAIPPAKKGTIDYARAISARLESKVKGFDSLYSGAIAIAENEQALGKLTPEGTTEQRKNAASYAEVIQKRLQSKLRKFDELIVKAEADLDLHNIPPGGLPPTDGSSRISKILGLAVSSFFAFQIAQMVFGALASVSAATIGKALEDYRAEMTLKVTGGQSAVTSARAEAARQAQQLGVSQLEAFQNQAKLTAAFDGTRLEGQAGFIGGGLTALGSLTGASKEQQRRAQIAIAQIAGKNQLYAEEVFGQLAEAIPGLPQKIAEAAGVNIQQLRALMKRGGAGSELLSSGIGAAGRAAETVNQNVIDDNPDTKINRFLNEVEKLQTTLGNNALGPLAEGAKVAAGAIGFVTDNLGLLIKTGVAGLALLTLNVLSATGAFKTMALAVESFGGLGPAMKAIGGSIKIIAAEMAANIALVGAIVTLIDTLGQSFTNLTGGSGVAKEIANSFDAVNKALDKVIAKYDELDGKLSAKPEYLDGKAIKDRYKDKLNIGEQALDFLSIPANLIAGKGLDYSQSAQNRYFAEQRQSLENFSSKAIQETLTKIGNTSDRAITNAPKLQELRKEQDRLKIEEATATGLDATSLERISKRRSEVAAEINQLDEQQQTAIAAIKKRIDDGRRYLDDPQLSNDKSQVKAREAEKAAQKELLIIQDRLTRTYKEQTTEATKTQLAIQKLNNDFTIAQTRLARQNIIQNAEIVAKYSGTLQAGARATAEFFQGLSQIQGKRSAAQTALSEVETQLNKPQAKEQISYLQKLGQLPADLSETTDAQLAELEKQGVLSANNKALITKYRELKELFYQLFNDEVSRIDKRRDAIASEAKAAREYFQNTTMEIEKSRLASIEGDRQLRDSNFSSRVKTALGGTTTAVGSYISSMIDIMVELGELSKIESDRLQKQMDVNRDRLNNQRAFEDRERNATDGVSPSIDQGSYTPVNASFYYPGEGNSSMEGGKKDWRGRYLDRHMPAVAARTTGAPGGIPDGAVLEIKDPRTGKTTRAKVVDRGPLFPGRDIDLTPAVAQALGIKADGVASLEARVVSVPSGRLQEQYDLGTGEGRYDKRTGQYIGAYGKPIRSGRSAPSTGSGRVEVQRTGFKDANGLEELETTVFDSAGGLVRRFTANSGSPRNQNFFDSGQSASGSGAPLEYGRYQIKPEVPGANLSTVGKVFVPLAPEFRTKRAYIGAHADANRLFAPGSAGCLVFKTEADFNAFRKAIADANATTLDFAKPARKNLPLAQVTGKGEIGTGRNLNPGVRASGQVSLNPDDVTAGTSPIPQAGNYEPLPETRLNDSYGAFKAQQEEADRLSRQINDQADELKRTAIFNSNAKTRAANRKLQRDQRAERQRLQEAEDTLNDDSRALGADSSQKTYVESLIRTERTFKKKRQEFANQIEDYQADLQEFDVVLGELKDWNPPTPEAQAAKAALIIKIERGKLTINSYRKKTEGFLSQLDKLYTAQINKLKTDFAREENKRLGESNDSVLQSRADAIQAQIKLIEQWQATHPFDLSKGDPLALTREAEKIRLTTKRNSDLRTLDEEERKAAQEQNPQIVANVREQKKLVRKAYADGITAIDNAYTQGVTDRENSQNQQITDRKNNLTEAQLGAARAALDAAGAKRELLPTYEDASTIDKYAIESQQETLNYNKKIREISQQLEKDKTEAARQNALELIAAENKRHDAAMLGIKTRLGNELITNAEARKEKQLLEARTASENALGVSGAFANLLNTQGYSYKSKQIQDAIADNQRVLTRQQERNELEKFLTRRPELDRKLYEENLARKYSYEDQQIAEARKIERENNLAGLMNNFGQVRVSRLQGAASLLNQRGNSFDAFELNKQAALLNEQLATAQKLKEFDDLIKANEGDNAAVMAIRQTREEFEALSRIKLDSLREEWGRFDSMIKATQDESGNIIGKILTGQDVSGGDLNNLLMAPFKAFSNVIAQFISSTVNNWISGLLKPIVNGLNNQIAGSSAQQSSNSGGDFFGGLLRGGLGLLGIKFADGGVVNPHLPASLVDNRWIMARDREAIMIPEFTDAVGGAEGIAKLNRWAKFGGAFADGGVVSGDPLRPIAGLATPIPTTAVNAPSAPTVKRIQMEVTYIQGADGMQYVTLDQFEAYRQAAEYSQQETFREYDRYQQDRNYHSEIVRSRR